MKLFMGCDDGFHDYREAYDEHPSGARLENFTGDSVEMLRAGLYYRTLRAIYCRRCGNMLPVKDSAPREQRAGVPT